MTLFNGRPMRLVEHLFIDRVSGDSVGLYEDTLGRFWMASGPWSLFRIRSKR